MGHVFWEFFFLRRACYWSECEIYVRLSETWAAAVTNHPRLYFWTQFMFHCCDLWPLWHFWSQTIASIFTNSCVLWRLFFLHILVCFLCIFCHSQSEPEEVRRHSKWDAAPGTVSPSIPLPLLSELSHNCPCLMCQRRLIESHLSDIVLKLEPTPCVFTAASATDPWSGLDSSLSPASSSPASERTTTDWNRSS